MEIVNIKDIGEVKFTRSEKAKRLSIKIKPFDGVCVTVPKVMLAKEAVGFVIENKEWIRQNIHKAQEKENKLTVFSPQNPFTCRFFKMLFIPAQTQNLKISYSNHILKVFYAPHINFTSPIIQEQLRGAIEETLRYFAKQYLPVRIKELATQYGFTYNQIFIKNLKSRWGSCSYVNNINLNLHLLRLPQHLLDNTLLHELCHTLEKNHGPNFWALLNKVTHGNAKTLDRAMKDYHTKIY